MDHEIACNMEERDQKLQSLRAHLLSSELELKQRKVMDYYSIDAIIDDLNKE